MSKKKHSRNEEVNLASLAENGLNSILKFAKSDRKEDKLIGFNAMLFFLISTLSIAFYFTKDFNDMFSVLIHLFLSGLFAAILSIGYLKVFEIISNVVSNDEFAIKSSISILFFNFSVTLIGYLFTIETLIKVGYGLLFVQIFSTLVFGFIKLPIKQKLASKADKKIDIWVILDKISIITGIINFFVWGITILIKFIL